MKTAVGRTLARLIALAFVAAWPGAAQAQHVEVLHAFAGSNFAFTEAAVIQGTDGRFYRSLCPADGSTGEIFVLNESGAVTLLHQFDRNTEGSCPNALVHAQDGNLYGTTQAGGASAVGTLFRLTLTGTLTVLHTFTGGADGGKPRSGLIELPDGTLYGTTLVGGAANRGTVYRYTSGGGHLVLHSFAGGALDGAAPSTALVLGSDGNFYGTTVGGGELNRGVFFRMTLSGETTVLHAFTGLSADGSVSTGNIVEALDGNFYGVSTYGRFLTPNTSFVCPVYFRVSTAGAFERLPVPEQCSPPTVFRFNLTVGRNGQLLGTADSFGSSSLFSLAADGRLMLLWRLVAGTEGGFLLSPLAAASDGDFYGTTGAGGAAGGGTFFRLRVVPDAPTDIAVTSLQGQVRLSWTPSSNPASYTIRRREAGGAPSILATGVMAPAFVDATAIRHHHYYYLVSAVNESGETVASYEVSIRAGRATANDFDGDGVADIAVWTAAGDLWSIRRSTTGTPTFFRLRGMPCAGDYDGDGITDAAGFWPFDGEYQIRYSSSGRTEVLKWGGPEDRAVPGDYDGDGLTDVATFRHVTGMWYIRQSSTLTVVAIPFGALRDSAVPRDYDGDGVTDLAVVRPSTGAWFIRLSSSQSMVTIQPGITGSPVPADYDGDGKADVALYRESDGTWHIFRSRAQSWSVVSWGGIINDRPAPADYDGDGRIDVAIFRSSTGIWYLLRSATASPDSISWGVASDTPTPADYDGDGRTDVAVYRGGSDSWYIRESSTSAQVTVSWIFPGSRPVPGDYDGDGRTDIAAFTTHSTHAWQIRLSSTGIFTEVAWGGLGDTPVPGDYDGDRKTDVAVFRASTGTWHVKLSASSTSQAVTWGGIGDVPVPGDYDGDGTTDIAVFRPSTGTWYIRQSRTLTMTTMLWGFAGDVPVPSDYDGDGLTDVAVFRPPTGGWHIRLSATQAPLSGSWGTSGDIPVAGDYDGDGRSEVAVFRPASGAWHIAGSAGPPSDIRLGSGLDSPIASEPVTFIAR